MSFEGQVAIVTGAASGIGRATATLLGKAGAQVVVADVNEERGNTVAQDIRSNGGEAMFHRVDLTSLSEIQALAAATVERYGQIDVLANVAAIYPSAPFLETTPEAWEQIITIDLRGVFFLTQEVIRRMVPRERGSVINVASGAAFRPVPGMAAYSAAKGGLVSMSRTIAHEVAKHRIRVNVVAPGHTASETVVGDRGREALDAMATSLVPGRWMEPEEVAEAIVFLASNAASGMTGAIINVNGGDYMPH